MYIVIFEDEWGNLYGHTIGGDGDPLEVFDSRLVAEEEANWYIETTGLQAHVVTLP